MFIPQIDRLVQERRNPIANALELYCSCINPSKWSVESNAWFRTWWRHKMEIFSALLALCAENSPVICEFPSQRPVTRNLYGFFHLQLNKRLNKTVNCRWFEALCHDDVIKWKHFPRYWPFVRGIHRSRWIPRTKASDAELWCFLWSAPE